MNEFPETDAAWEEIAPHLDAALAELTEPDRDAVLLRYFENKPAQEMAEILGISAEAAQKRVSRAVEKLRGKLAKRGITAGTAGLTEYISANALQAAPAGLAVTVSATALAGAAASTAITATKAAFMAFHWKSTHRYGHGSTRWSVDLSIHPTRGLSGRNGNATATTSEGAKAKTRTGRLTDREHGQDAV